jgi:RimJ/RimL family protein N-acetyltransferase
MTTDIQLRDVTNTDLPIFFAHQLDPDANHMAAFTTGNPADRDAFMRHWRRILSDDTCMIRTVLFKGEVAGSVASYVDAGLGEPEVTYWLGREFWGKGIATRALSEFLRIQTTRPIYGRAAKDNFASIRVLEKCGFVMVGSDRGFAKARGAEIEEVILKLE